MHFYVFRTYVCMLYIYMCILISMYKEQNSKPTFNGYAYLIYIYIFIIQLSAYYVCAYNLFFTCR